MQYLRGFDSKNSLLDQFRSHGSYKNWLADFGALTTCLTHTVQYSSSPVCGDWTHETETANDSTHHLQNKQPLKSESVYGKTRK